MKSNRLGHNFTIEKVFKIHNFIWFHTFEMAHVFLNILIANLYQNRTFHHISFIGNRFLPSVIKSQFTYFTYPLFKDVSGLTVNKCAFKHAISNVINIQPRNHEYEPPNEL